MDRSRIWLSIFLSALLVAPLAEAQVRTEQADPYLTYSGDAIRWPSGPLPALHIGTITEHVEMQEFQRIRVHGAVEFILNSSGPFRLADPKPGFSLYLQDIRVPSGGVGFSILNKDQFMQSVNDESLMRYCKGLKLSETRGRKVQILEGPEARIAEHLRLLAPHKPRPITWQLDVPGETPVRRTDFFYEFPDVIMVISAIGSDTDHAGVRSALEEVLRFGYIRD